MPPIKYMALLVVVLPPVSLQAQDRIYRCACLIQTSPCRASRHNYHRRRTALTAHHRPAQPSRAHTFGA